MVEEVEAVMQALMEEMVVLVEEQILVLPLLVKEMFLLFLLRKEIMAVVD